MSKQSVPGPGQYKTIEMSGVGKYPLQRMKNSGAACWSPPSSKRFADESRLGGNLPHHSTYTPDDTSNGTYLLSQQKSYHVPKIGPSFGPIKQIDDRKTKAEERKKRTCKLILFRSLLMMQKRLDLAVTRFHQSLVLLIVDPPLRIETTHHQVSNLECNIIQKFKKQESSLTQILA